VILAYFGDLDTVILGSFLLMLAAVFFLWFVRSLRAVRRRAEGGVGRLSAIAYCGGLAAAAFMLALPASNVLGALYAKQLSPEGAQTFFLFGNVFPVSGRDGRGRARRGHGAHRASDAGVAPWLGLLSLAFALWLLIPPLGSAGGTPENPPPGPGWRRCQASRSGRR